MRYRPTWLDKVILLLLLILIPACGQPAEPDVSLQHIKSAGTLVVGMDATYPPFDDSDGRGHYRGLDVDLAQQLASGLGVRLIIFNTGVDGLHDTLVAKKVDLVISALQIAPEWGKDVAFSTPYFNAGQVLVVPRNSTIHSITDLRGERVGVEQGADGEVVARQIKNTIPVLFDETALALAALQKGTVPAVIVDATSAGLYSHTHPGVQVIGQPLTTDSYAVAVRIKDQALLTQINTSLERMRHDGTLAALRDRWVGGVQ